MALFNLLSSHIATLQAVPNGDAAILQRVLADGASVEHSDSEGNTALILAAAKGSPLDFLNVLLTHGLHPSTPCDYLAGVYRYRSCVCLPFRDVKRVVITLINIFKSHLVDSKR